MYCFQKMLKCHSTHSACYIFYPSFFFFPPYATDFPNVVPLKFGPGNFLVTGVPLCIATRLVAFLPSTLQMPVAAPIKLGQPKMLLLSQNPQGSPTSLVKHWTRKKIFKKKICVVFKYTVFSQFSFLLISLFFPKKEINLLKGITQSKNLQLRYSIQPGASM